ncbi:MAG TPA: hypothetical protein VFB90_02350 [Dehalococcoidia bacterium]|nr:hypothetical protein [Dehalococcoidia bacterium]
MDTIELNLMAGWSAIGMGFLSGALMGLRFARAEWLGGYASLRRRLVRLGHIAFTALGFVNIGFALSLQAVPIGAPWREIASLSFIVGAGAMPLVCFLAAWRDQLRALFPVPVISLLLGVVSLLVGWGLS